MRDHSNEKPIQPHRYKPATQQARRSAWDTIDLDDLEEKAMPGIYIYMDYSQKALYPEY